MQLFEIHTESGSKYRVRIDDQGKFWLSGENKASIFSSSIQGSEWAIKTPVPWPAVVGERLYMESTYIDKHEHPSRIPGGGKNTSPIIEVVNVSMAPVMVD